MKRRLALLYLLLLVASFFVTRHRRGTGQEQAGRTLITLPDASRISVRAGSNVLVVAEADLLTGALHIHPPGSGASSDPGSLSPEAQAARIASLAILPDEPMDLVAAGSAAAAAIELAAGSPERFPSLTLVDPLRIRAGGSVGDPFLDELLEAGRYGLLRMADLAIPHFGAIDRTPFRPARARARLHTDPEHVRKRLAELDQPVLLTSAGALDPAFSAFQSEVRAGRAPAQSGAPADWTALAEPEGPREPLHGKAMLWMMLAIILSSFVSEDLACIAAGLLVWQGVLGFFPAVIAAFTGLVVGDLTLYTIGAMLGPSTLRRRPFRWLVSPRKVERQKRRFQKNLFGLVFASRFVPGSRVPMYVAGGVLHVGFVPFALSLFVACAVWVPLLVGLSAWSGSTFLAWFESNRLAALWSVVGLIACLWLIMKKGLPLFTWRGRRLALSQWRRLTRWEFWPRWAFYPPVVLHIAGLMIRHRSLTLPLITNPGMPHSGFVMERKSEIFRGLGPTDALPDWELLDHDLEPAEAAAAAARVGFPCVLKPDIGYRGQDVHFLQEATELEAARQAIKADAIAQQRVEGPEFGVFYERSPDAETGRVTSITEKVIPQVIGDGESSLERLILSDERAVCMAPTFLARFTARLDEVPAKGTVLPLGSLGTHSQGAIFLDATQLRTPELEAAMDAICLPYQGFYFGRFDLRVPDIDHLQRGEGIRMLELNGLTAESTHIYDPRHRLRYGWKTIMDQWTRAFAIAETNRRNGHRTPGFRALFSLLGEFFRT